MDTSIENLPQAPAITNVPIRTAAEALATAQAEENAAKELVVRLEQPKAKEDAEWVDAAAIKAGKKPTAVAAHAKELDAAKLALKVAILTTDDARRELSTAYEANAEAYAGELGTQLEAADLAWANAVEQLLEVHGERSTLVGIARRQGIQHRGVEVVGLKRHQIDGLEYVNDSPSEGYVNVSTLIDALGESGMGPVAGPEPEPEPADPTYFEREVEDRVREKEAERAEYEEAQAEAAERQKRKRTVVID
jgi:hypothetical protein